MTAPKPQLDQNISTRDTTRYSGYRDLQILYEGSSQDIPVRAPDISLQGMFINTAKHFAEGAVIKISFRLSRTNHVVRVRAEVRYCLEGVGIGVEFIDISPEDRQAIEDEMTRK